MPASVLYMSMSLDGYIAGPNDEPGNPGGDGFDRLHEWFRTPDGEFGRPDGAGRTTVGRNECVPARCWRVGVRWSRSITGAVIITGVQIFVPSHRPPGPSVAGYPLVTYVTDGIESAMARRRLRPGIGT